MKALENAAAHGGGDRRAQRHRVRRGVRRTPLLGQRLDTQRLTCARREPARSPTPSETPPVKPAQPPTPTAPPTPEDVLSPGDRGEQVRELQSRLYQLAWLPELTTGRYDADTTAAVAGFQDKRGFKATGKVDQRTWHRLVKMTKTPTHDQMYNILHPGPAILASGSAGEDVRDLQARLKQIAWYFGDVTGTLRRGDRHGDQGLPGEARDPGDRRGRPAHDGPADGDDLRAHPRPDVQHRAAARRAGSPLPGRPGAVHRQVQPDLALGGERAGAEDGRRALRRVRDPDPRGPVLGAT